jgi:hypothetical protein
MNAGLLDGEWVPPVIAGGGTIFVLNGNQGGLLFKP